MLITMVMGSCVLINTPTPDPTYSPALASVNTIATTTQEFNYELITKTNTAGTTAMHIARDSVGLSPRLVAQPGESQDVIDSIVATFPEAPVMVEVARCESKLNPKANRKGIDGGLFQINQVHLPTLAELGLDRFDLQDNLKYSRMLYDWNGLRDWNMSRYCWGKYT